MPPSPQIVKRYKAVLVAFMSYHLKSEFGKDKEFDVDALGSITPEDVGAWLNFKAFGTASPGDESQPTQARSSSLAFYKKAVSYYMPNSFPWNELAKQGNPTKSKLVNNIMARVAKAEVRKEGVQSSARRPLTIREYKKIVSLLQNHEDYLRKVKIATMMKFQFHLIARIDDTCNMFTEEIRARSEFPGTLTCRLRWSKNVMEERDAPEQLILAAREKEFDLITQLAIYLQYYLQFGSTSDLLFCEQGCTSARLKQQVSKSLKQLFDSDEFRSVENDDRPVGTHSGRKCPSTYAAQNGCSSDEVEVRGRWKTESRKQVTTYIDIKMPYKDGKVAAALCLGGPVRFLIKEDSGVSDDWILENVVPHIATRLGNSVATIMGRALLSACMEDEWIEAIPTELREEVQSAYTGIRVL